MAINSNHISEELDGVKCAIVEKNVSPERVAFLKPLLEYNTLKVVVVPTPPPAPAKAAAPKPVPVVDPVPVDAAEPPLAAAPVPTEEPAPPPPKAPETFTVGVTNMLFNPVNAVMGRLLRTPDGHVVTQAYWQQKENVSHDETPYYDRK
jgi:hypothetical protein